MLVDVVVEGPRPRREKGGLLAGGLGASSRLRDMLNIMCEERRAKFYVPKKRFMGDDGSMIVYTGLVMVKAGVTTPLAK
ncbi:MAG TPA: hypothetical protein PLY09_04710 [Methanothrix sp.]|nr:hypothetical protein [Methanothrix sp.]HPJ84046.1 hypothetical protein [Methanothrix sp.]